MSHERLTQPDIAEMQGTAALPRKSGEMVFHDEWERRAFAIAVSLSERRILDWYEFQQRLIERIAEAERENPRNPKLGYYESWLAALEGLLEDNDLLIEAIADET